MKDNRLLEMRVFKALVDAGSFTAAAHVLGLSQPFVSQTITQLERRLGVRLLHRSTRGRRLTEEGERYLVSCRRILDEVEQAEAEISAARSQVSGDLRITAPLAFGLDQIVPRLPAFMAEHPQVIVHLALTDSVANLIEENVDVAVRMGRLEDSSLMSRKLCDLQRIVVAAPSYIASHGAPNMPHELSRHNCLMWEGPLDHLNRWPFLVDGRAQSLLVKGNFRSTSGQTMFELCCAGMGIMRLAEHLALPAIANGSLVPLLEEYRGQDDTAIHAVFLPERELLPRIRAFVDYLVQVFVTPPWSRR
ncbi:LysR family transcriptional regulator [Pseudomonas benzenivorans]|uniref:LysR family transcriptional regulator n=1 Tax=Pseudomonas benzenivorans TaxID=556533 RepID=A0ABY5H4U0_9PSED|nr:LysR family transcriptional regulator [Pseudomonas benzenivorans]UTW06877.1 LysR family transcriptional regulator [Pseudomonas benzenivorans]